MQEDSALERTFFQRTNRLAADLCLDVEDLPGILGMGRRTLFECRSADSEVSAKSWLKLEAAERRAEKPPAPPGIAQSSASPKQPDVGISAHVMREDPAPYRVPPKPELTTDQRLARLEGIMERVASALEELVEKQRRDSK